MSAPRIASVTPHVFRWPVAEPVRTSFGVMHDRPMLLVEVRFDDGVTGWGEAWCNFPSVGAEHRAALLRGTFAPLLEGREAADPATVFAELTRATAVLAIQSGEPGPVAQCIAALDIALWDAHARRAGQPLWRLLGGQHPTVKVYASGINPQSPERMAARCAEQGHRAFKLKVGFGAERDLGNLAAMRRELGDSARLMVDANQAWSPREAGEMAQRLGEHRLEWLEEPLRADTPLARWQALARESPVPLAAGENLQGEEAFAEATGSGAFAVIQPDMAKWGGFSGCLPVAMRILAARRRYCPHYLGGGIGLLASAHLLAAVGGDGKLEVDANPNPLRTLCWGPLGEVRDGTARLTEAPGLGIEPDLAALAAACARGG